MSAPTHRVKGIPGNFSIEINNVRQIVTIGLCPGGGFRKGGAAMAAAPCRTEPEGIRCHVFAAAAPSGGGGITNGSRPRESAAGRS